MALVKVGRRQALCLARSGSLTQGRETAKACVCLGVPLLSALISRPCFLFLGSMSLT